MKRTIHIILPTAALLVVPATLRGQDASLFDEPAAAPAAPAADVVVGIDEAATVSEFSSPADANAAEISRRVEELQRELEGLNAATRKRQQDLQRQMTELFAAKRAAEEAANHARAGIPYTASRRTALPVVSWRIGVQVAPSGKEGVAVAGVMPDTPAARADVKAGDVIESVNGIKVRDVAALNAIIHAAQGQELSFGVRRGGDRIMKEIKAERINPDPRVGGGFGSFGGGVGAAPPGRLDAFGAGGGNQAFQIVPAQPNAPAAPRPPQVLELRPRNLPGHAGGPDSAELHALKNEIAELRALVSDLADHLADEVDDGEEEEGEDEDDEDSDPEEEADPFG